LALGRPLRAAAFVFAVVICATSGCGLPDARPNLAPPVEPHSSDTGKQFTFTVPGSTAAPFLGVEVYYRIFPVGDRNGEGIETVGELMGAGFVRMAGPDDRDIRVHYPLIDGPAANSEVTLDFDPVTFGEEPFASFRGRNGTVRRTLRRGIAEDGEFKRFLCTEFDDGDDDVVPEVRNQLADTEDCGIVQLVAYALSYGGNDRFTVYSDAVFLGTIGLTFGRP
jgi:hypothetical protein